MKDRVKENIIKTVKTVSVIIVNYNGERYIDDCISSLLYQDYPVLEIIIVDNNSTDRSEEVIRKYKEVKLIKLKENVGLAEGCNVGARVAKGEFLCFVNNDMKFEKNFISSLVQELYLNSELFAVDALHYNWQGDRILHAGSVLKKTTFYKGHIPGYRLNPVAIVDRKIDVPWGCLANLMVKRDKFFELNGFDRTFFMDYEDADLCWRAWLRGWRTVYIPGAKAYHKVGMSTEVSGMGTMRAFHQHKNYMRFILKCMDVNIIMKMFFSLPLRAAIYLLKGRFNLIGALLKAILKIGLEWRDIMRERAEIIKNKKISNKFLLKKFLVHNSN